MSDSFKGTTPRIGSCCLCRWSRTVTVTIPDLQSLMNLSVPALKMGLLLTAFARVRYTCDLVSDYCALDHILVVSYQLIVEQDRTIAGGQLLTLFVGILTKLLSWLVLPTFPVAFAALDIL